MDRTYQSQNLHHLRGLLIIGISGLAGAGKDTLAEVCRQRGFVRVGLADEVKRLALIMDPWILEAKCSLVRLVAEQGWEVAKRQYPEVRRFLQAFATEVVRDNVDPNTWLNLAWSKIFSIEADHRANSHGLIPVVIPDIRFPNEVQFFSKMACKCPAEFIMWRVDRPGLESDGHASESHQLEADLVFKNDKSIEYLQGLAHNALDDLFHNPSRFYTHRRALRSWEPMSGFRETTMRNTVL